MVEDVDVVGDGIGWGRCLRIRDTIDLFKPLKCGRALDIKKKSVWVSFKYENLPTFCFRCGRLVHKKLTCPVRPNLKFHENVGVKEWGTWFRAEPPRKKLFLHGGGEGDFHHSPTRQDTGGGFRQEWHDGGADNAFLSNHNSVRGPLSEEGRAAVESWTNGSGNVDHQQLGQSSIVPKLSEEQLCMEKCGDHGCMEKMSHMRSKEKVHGAVVGQSTYSPTLLRVSNCGAAGGNTLKGKVHVATTCMELMEDNAGETLDLNPCSLLGHKEQ